MKIALFQNHANDPLSWAIRLFTRGQYVHAALLVDEAELTIIEAYYPHVRKRTLAPAELAGIDFYDVPGLTGAQVKGAIDYATSAITEGEDYSIANLFRFLPAGRMVLGEATDKNEQSSVFCSQFVFDVIERGCGVKLLNCESWDVSPVVLGWSPLIVKADKPAAQLVASKTVTVTTPTETTTVSQTVTQTPAQVYAPAAS